MRALFCLYLLSLLIKFYYSWFNDWDLQHCLVKVCLFKSVIKIILQIFIFFASSIFILHSTLDWILISYGYGPAGTHKQPGIVQSYPGHDSQPGHVCAAFAVAGCVSACHESAFTNLTVSVPGTGNVSDWHELSAASVGLWQPSPTGADVLCVTAATGRHEQRAAAATQTSEIKTPSALKGKNIGSE